MQMGPIRKAIADAAREVEVPGGIAALTCTGFVPDALTVPHFFTADYTLDFDRAMNRGLDVAELTCQVMVGTADNEASQRLLDGFLAGAGPSSLKAAIEAARGAPGESALGGLADDFHVTRVQGYRWYDHGGAKYLGAEFVIRIIGEGA